MRGVRRTPRGLQAQQINSRAVGGHQHLSRRTTADALSRQDRKTKRKANQKVHSSEAAPESERRKQKTRASRTYAKEQGRYENYALLCT